MVQEPLFCPTGIGWSPADPGLQSANVIGGPSAWASLFRPFEASLLALKTQSYRLLQSRRGGWATLREDLNREEWPQKVGNTVSRIPPLLGARPARWP